ncbi:EamA family transporter [Nocardia sp. NBC_01503]|uniref:EamA family transporter n=1 Tax=Nocardia sp. NBC_01503 TaxID=2975997 RepID=UPI002E7C203B|nr:EamA family transporter [Nocardia sp. NBC_01503]WTL30228.1 EamA family transporter [Nocardia sp. NBC_01503]
MQLTFFVAVDRVPVAVVMVLVNLAPALVALWVQTVRRIRLPGLVWLGIGLAVAGLVMVAQLWRDARLDLLGVAAGLGSAVCSAGYFLLGERGASRHDPIGLTAVGLAVGAIVMAVFAPPWTLPSELLTAPAVLRGLQAPVWLVLLTLAIAGTVLPYLAGLLALRDLPPALASVLAVVEPLVATALAWLLLGQSLELPQMVGAVIMLFGAMLVQLTSPETAQAIPD